MTEHIEEKNVRVGVAAIIRRKGHILMGKRKGSHGAGTWSFPGGHLEWHEKVGECASREVKEETGIFLYPLDFRPLTFTNDIFTVEGKHYITLYVETDLDMKGDWGQTQEAQIMEPNKCEEWRWFSSPPDPLFLPVKNLLHDGFKLWR